MQSTRLAWPARTKPRISCKNDSRLLKNSEGNRDDDEWTFFRGQETRISKNDQKNLQRKLYSRLLPESGRSQATNLKTQKQTKWIEMHQSQVKMCFLRGPLR